MKNVQFLKFPGRVLDFTVEDGSTVKDLLDLVKADNPEADVTGEPRVNNCTVNNDRILNEGERVVIAKKVKGNQSKAKVQKFPGRGVEVEIEPNSTVKDAIDASRLEDVEGYQIRMDGVEVEDNKIIPDDGVVHRIILTKKVKGN